MLTKCQVPLFRGRKKAVHKKKKKELIPTSLQAITSSVAWCLKLALCLQLLQNQRSAIELHTPSLTFRTIGFKGKWIPFKYQSSAQLQSRFNVQLATMKMPAAQNPHSCPCLCAHYSRRAAQTQPPPNMTHFLSGRGLTFMDPLPCWALCQNFPQKILSLAALCRYAELMDKYAICLRHPVQPLKLLLTLGFAD